MSKFYNPQRTRNIFDPKSSSPFKLSRSKLELFLDCPKCFYLDRRIGIGRPPGFPFNLNSAVDALLKKEFDRYRALKKTHPLMEQFKIDGIPFAHEKIDEWRDSLHKGIQHCIDGTCFVFTGGVDDVWVNTKGELMIVDYKATSKSEEVTLDAEWQDGYKRQMEMYQWLFRKNKFSVNNTGYFVYCNGKADADGFDAKLHFDIKIIPYTGDSSWVDGAIEKAIECLMSDKIPEAEGECDYCRYVSAVTSKS